MVSVIGNAVICMGALLLSLPVPQPMDGISYDPKHITATFLNAGLMLVEFHPACVARAIQSARIHPMRSDIPAFVVRSIARIRRRFSESTTLNVIWRGRR
jgi:hypothetical protein